MCSSGKCIYGTNWEQKYDRLIWDVSNPKRHIAGVKYTNTAIYPILFDPDEISEMHECFVCDACSSDLEVRTQQLFLLLRESNKL